MKEKPTNTDKLVEQLPLDYEAATKRAERLQLIQYLHWTAFKHQWEADGHAKDENKMHAAFTKQQKQMAKQIQVAIRFTNQTRPLCALISDQDTDFMLMAIYVTGLEVLK